LAIQTSLAVGEVLGVLPQRVAAALQLLGPLRETETAQHVPHPAAHDVERLGRPPADVERVQAQGGVLAAAAGTRAAAMLNHALTTELATTGVLA